MKTTVTILVALVFLAGLGGLVWKRQRVANIAERQHAAALQAEVRALEARLPDMPVRDAFPARESSLTPAPSAAPAAPPIAPPNPALLQDPETRALMRKQQEQGLQRLAEKLINKNFVRDWDLSPAQANQVKDLVREKAGAGKDMLNAMMFDGLDDAALAARGRETKERIAQADEALRGVLGTAGFEALTQQERALEDRDRLKRIREEMIAAEQPLAESQQEALLAAIGAERAAFPFRVDYSDPSKVDFERLREFFSEANLQMYFEDMQQLNARILERAALFLSPAQIEQIKITQQNQLEQGRLTVKVTTELFNKPRGK